MPKAICQQGELSKTDDCREFAEFEVPSSAGSFYFCPEHARRIEQRASLMGQKLEAYPYDYISCITCGYWRKRWG